MSLRDLHAQGTTIVLVEQSINVALELASGRSSWKRVRFVSAVPRATCWTVPTCCAPSSSRVARLIEEPVDRAGQCRDAERRCTNHRPVLSIRNISKRFGGVTAANDVTFALGQGEILGLIGHNGAGKTTLMDMISGFTRVDEGKIVFEGMDIGLLPPHQRAALGLGRTFQNAQLFPSLTVAETISVAYERHLASRDLLAAGLRLPASLDSEAEVADEVSRADGVDRVDRLRRQPGR